MKLYGIPDAIRHASRRRNIREEIFSYQLYTRTRICRSKSYVKATVLVNKAKLERHEGLFRDPDLLSARSRYLPRVTGIAADCKIRLIVAAMQHCRPHIMTETPRTSRTICRRIHNGPRADARRRKEGRNEAERDAIFSRSTMRP